MSLAVTSNTLNNPFVQNQQHADSYRHYDDNARAGVKDLYQLNHQNQTLDFVLAKEAEYIGTTRVQLGMWEVFERLDAFVDDSDPDLALPQTIHALQTAEAIRQDGHPRWFILAGFIHDLGKMLCTFGEPQWAVVGDTYPVGCAFSDKIVYPELFAANPDSRHPVYSTPNGIYEPRCGLEKVHISWGHDEYLYHVVKNHLPQEALWMIRYHSCYPVHREGAYTHLLNDGDQELLKWVRAFNPYDLYSKCEVEPDLNELRPYYEDLIAEYFPAKLNW